VAYDQLILVFTGIIYEALPFIVLGVVIAGLLEEFVPQQAIARIIPSNRLFAIGLGGILGAVFPMCECGIIVVMKRLLRKGLPLSVCVAYVLAGPVINVVVITSTYVAFNPPQAEYRVFGGPVNVVLLRGGLAYLVAVVTAWIVEGQWRRHGTDLLHPSITRGLQQDDEEEEDEAEEALEAEIAKSKSALGMIATLLKGAVLAPLYLIAGIFKAIRGNLIWRRRFANITETALNDFVDIMAFLVLGAAVAALGRLAVRQGNFVDIIQNQPAISILIMMGLAILFCLCSEADAFVAANFQTFWPPASKMAFLVLGPMLDLKLYIMYTRVFRTRLIFTIITSVVVQVFVYSMILHYLTGAPPSSTAVLSK
jgi:uncharacterized protein